MFKRSYYNRKGYKVRNANAPYVDEQPTGTVYQPDIYDMAFFLARRAGCDYIIDIGAGEGGKLKPVAKEFNIIAIECDTNFDQLKKNLPKAQIINYDLENGLPEISADILARAVVVTSDVVEHIVEPHEYLRGVKRLADICPFVLISTPDRTRARGVEDYGPPYNPFHVREWNADEFYSLLKDYGINTNVGFTVSNDDDMFKATILAVAGTQAMYSGLGELKKVLAVMTAYNEEDIIEASIRHALSQGMEVHVIENWSTDKTLSIVKKLAKEINQVTYEQFPIVKPSKSVYDWNALLRRVESYANSCNADWVIHNDADELRISPWRDITVQQAISMVDYLGYNAIDITVMDFRPTKDGFKRGVDPAVFFHDFEFTQIPSYLQQIKGWKNIAKVDLASSGGHHAKMPEQRIYPIKFASKHYPIRSTEQAKKKIFIDRKARFSVAEKRKGWHTQYDHYSQSSGYIWNEKYLSKFTSGNYFNDFIVERMSGVGILPRKKNGSSG